jgi:hypothetical protein
MKALLGWATAGGFALAALVLLLPPRSAAEQSTPQKAADAPQPAGDAVAPRAGERKSPTDAPGAAALGGRGRPREGQSSTGTVRTLRLPEFEPDLPEGKGRNTVVVVCGSCHSTRYITIQPPLSRETWAAEVTKMQMTFGAPVPPDKVVEILEYLVAVRGTPAK